MSEKELEAGEVVAMLRRMAEADYVRGMLLVDHSKWPAGDAGTGVPALLEQAAALILAQEAKIERGWRDVSDAPKDGTRVIITWACFVSVGYWRDHREPGFPEYRWEDGDWIGWTRVDVQDRPLPVRAWMPLPSPLKRSVRR